MPHKIAVLVSTFERPRNLERCLESIIMQRDVDDLFEVMVTDDGSQDETLDLIRATAREVSFPLGYTTHTHEKFHLSRCRNEGVRNTSAPYLLFTDGDCILPPHHLAAHLGMQRVDNVVAGDSARLDEEASRQVDMESIRRWNVVSQIPAKEIGRLRRKARHAYLYEVLRVPMRPRLTGNNIALWRKDYERVNGFDERYAGWGYEDKDLQSRLERAGLRVRSIVGQSTPIHLWHPPDPSFARNGVDTSNRALFESPNRPVYCPDGLSKPDGSAAQATVWKLPRSRRTASIDRDDPTGR